MNFKEFEQKILEKGFAIAAMNHYHLNNKLNLFCVVMNTKKQIAFKAEGEDSEKVFENLYEQITNWENKK